MKKRQVVTNALMSTFQVLVSGISLFVLYRFFLDTIGVEAFGVWTVVLATTAIGGAAGAGLHGSMAKYVAKYHARRDDSYAARIVQTAAITVIVIVGFVVFMLSLVIHELLDFVLEPQFHSVARSLLPYALASFWITMLSSIYQSGIDGMQRVDLHNILVLITTVFYLGLCFYLVPKQGLLGLARAQLIQNTLLLVLSVTVLRRLLKSLPLFPFQWSWSTLKEIFAYSFNFQLISISQMLFMPTAKLILSKFGGAGAVTYFEMANKMAFQMRSLISTAHQALVPTISDLLESSPEKLHNFYITSFQTMIFTILALLPPLLFSVPTISYLWIGFYEPTFVLYGEILLIAWFFNLLVNPAYFGNMGMGQLRGNVVGQFALSVSNVLFGIGLGWFIGPIGVVISFAFGIQVGTMVTTGIYHRSHQIKTRMLLQTNDCRLLQFVVIGGVAAIILRELVRSSVPFPYLDCIVIICYFCFTLHTLVRHPMRHKLGEWIGSLVQRNRKNP